MARVLIGRTESITLAEAEEMQAKNIDELLGYLIELVDEATEDEEERANAKINLSSKVSSLIGINTLVALLKGDDDYLAPLLKIDPDVKFVEEAQDGKQ